MASCPTLHPQRQFGWHSVLRTLAALAVGVVIAAPSTAASSRPAIVPTCSWDRPGHAAFMGDVVAAVDDYVGIDAAVRERLKARMARRQYDDLVVIRRDEIVGRHVYEATIRDMHFATDRVCRSVTREAWSSTAQERGLVYCEDRECILVPTVCRNVSRIVRVAQPAGAPNSAAGSDAGSQEASSDHNQSQPASAGVAASESPASNLIPITPISTQSFSDLAQGPVVPGESASPGTSFTMEPVGGRTFLGYAGSSQIVGIGEPPQDDQLDLAGPRASPLAPSQPSWSQDSLPGRGSASFIDVPSLSGSGGAGVAPVAPIPEPPAWMMMTVGLLLLTTFRRRLRRDKR
jgi:hypothetical protein